MEDSFGTAVGSVRIPRIEASAVATTAEPEPVLLSVLIAVAESLLPFGHVSMACMGFGAIVTLVGVVLEAMLVEGIVVRFLEL